MKWKRWSFQSISVQHCGWYIWSMVKTAPSKKYKPQSLPSLPLWLSNETSFFDKPTNGQGRAHFFRNLPTTEDHKNIKSGSGSSWEWTPLNWIKRVQLQNLQKSQKYRTSTSLDRWYVLPDKTWFPRTKPNDSDRNEADFLLKFCFYLYRENLRPAKNFERKKFYSIFISTTDKFVEKSTRGEIKAVQIEQSIWLWSTSISVAKRLRQSIEKDHPSHHSNSDNEQKLH